MKTYPNQKIIHINKETHKNAYLSIEINEWIDASNNLTPNTFKLFLYLSSNADGFDLALSRQDVMNKLHISKDSYIRGVKELTDKHYIVEKQGNIFDFYTKPMYAPMHICKDAMYAPEHTVCMHGSIHDVCSDATTMYAPMHTEISTTSTTATLSNELADAQTAATLPEEERKKTLKDLSDEELKELAKDYRGEIKYSALYEKYNLCKGELNRELLSNIDSILSEREEINDKQLKEEFSIAIKEQLTDELQGKLTKYTHCEGEDLIELLLEADISPADTVTFLEEHDTFCYLNWAKESNSMSYFEWFKYGVKYNFKK